METEHDCSSAEQNDRKARTSGSTYSIYPSEYVDDRSGPNNRQLTIQNKLKNRFEEKNEEKEQERYFLRKKNPLMHSYWHQYV